MSEEDFFFEEEEKQKDAEKDVQPAAKRTPGAARTKSTPAPQGTIPTNIALVLAVIILLIGVMIGLLLGRGFAAPVATGTATTGTTAGQLTQDQLNQPVPNDDVHKGLGGGSTTATPTK